MYLEEAKLAMPNYSPSLSSINTVFKTDRTLSYRIISYHTYTYTTEHTYITEHTYYVHTSYILHTYIVLQFYGKYVEYTRITYCIPPLNKNA